MKDPRTASKGKKVSKIIRSFLKIYEADKMHTADFISNAKELKQLSLNKQ